MDSIRLSQINEALNYDKNINAMVFNLEKKRTAQFPDPEVLPYSQLGEETMTSTKEGLNSLKVLLEAKLVKSVCCEHRSGAVAYSGLQPSSNTICINTDHPTDERSNPHRGPLPLG